MMVPGSSRTTSPYSRWVPDSDTGGLAEAIAAYDNAARAMNINPPSLAPAAGSQDLKQKTGLDVIVRAEEPAEMA